GYFSKKMNILAAESVKQAKEIIGKTNIDIILTDFKMLDGDGLDVLKFAKSTDYTIEVIIMTAYGTIENAVEAMHLGAYNYIQKPIDLDELDLLIQRAIENYQLVRENIILKQQLKDTFPYQEIITESPKMKEILSMVGRIAPSEVSVLIQGESGTGKELIARAIHSASDKKDKPFIAFSAAALSENLIESELFGYEKGAFTGADKRNIGRFEQADGGTLFIDEIGEISLKIQVKLLRVLQERKFERVGGNITVNVDVRIITATNRDISKSIKDGLFREDLFYRINVVNINIPPLRERKEDIPILVKHFIQKHSKENRKNISDISKNALSELMRYDFPGNIRELENIIERAVILCRANLIKSDDIALPTIEKAYIKNMDITKGINLTKEVEKFEKQIMISTLKLTEGNQSEAARRLGINEKTFRYKLKKYNLK
ncbi:sigma-54-dependent transcriptional regulator, partial [candidate division KSB1 bacterium]